MRLTCQQSDLARALAMVNRAVAAKPTLPILGNVLLTAQDGRLILTGYDLEIGIRTEVPLASSGGKGQAALAVPAKIFSQMVSQFDEGEIALDFTDAHDVVLTSAGANYSLRGQPAQDFPDFPSFATGNGSAKEAPLSLSIKAKDLITGLRRTIFATAKESSRAFTSGVYLSTENELLVIVATDGRRLALDKVPLGDRKKLGKEEHSLLIPAKNLEDVLAILPLVSKEEDQLAIAFTSKLVKFALGTTDVLVHLLDAQFPDYEKVIPQHFSGKVELGREAFARTIRQVSIVAGQKEGRDMAILSTEGDALTVQSRVDNLGDARFTVATAREGEEMKVAFNYQYLLDAITNIDADSVELSYASWKDPGVLRIPTSSHYTYVLMPVRLGEQ